MSYLSLVIRVKFKVIYVLRDNFYNNIESKASQFWKSGMPFCHYNRDVQIYIMCTYLTYDL